MTTATTTTRPGARRMAPDDLRARAITTAATPTARLNAIADTNMPITRPQNAIPRAAKPACQAGKLGDVHS